MKTKFRLKMFTIITSQYLFTLFFVLMISLFTVDTYTESLRERQISALITILITSVIFIYFRKKAYLKHHIWELNNDTLTKGEPVNLEVDLSKVEKLIPKMPKPSGFYRYSWRINQTNSNGRQVNRQNEKALILKLNSSTYLPLNIIYLDGGEEIMKVISQKLTEKTDTEYEYNQVESLAITPLKFNKILNVDL